MRFNCNYLFQDYLNVNQFVLLSCLFLVTFLVFVLFNYYKNYLVLLGVLFLLAGAIGNIYMRVVHGCVKDTINFFDLFWFNFNDTFVVFGACVIWLALVLKAHKCENIHG